MLQLITYKQIKLVDNFNIYIISRPYLSSTLIGLRGGNHQEHKQTEKYRKLIHFFLFLVINLVILCLVDIQSGWSYIEETKRNQQRVFIYWRLVNECKYNIYKNK